jgi:hypothetical protein
MQKVKIKKIYEIFFTQKKGQFNIFIKNDKSREPTVFYSCCQI